MGDRDGRTMRMWILLSKGLFFGSLCFFCSVVASLGRSLTDCGKTALLKIRIK